MLSRNVPSDVRAGYARALLLTLCLFLSACAAQFAPYYDQALVDRLNATNTEVMTLFAAASGGTSANTFAAREDRYNNLIGRLDAMVIVAGARSISQERLTEIINELLQARGHQPLENDDATSPSAHAIQSISEALGKMRDTDKKQGLTAPEVMAFRGLVVIYFDQAITYEYFKTVRGSVFVMFVDGWNAVMRALGKAIYTATGTDIPLPILSYFRH
jgi:hypothetical protein